MLYVLFLGGGSRLKNEGVGEEESAFASRLFFWYYVILLYYARFMF